MNAFMKCCNFYTMSRKHSGERCKCCLLAFFPFLTILTIVFLVIIANTEDCLVKGYRNSLPNDKILDWITLKAFAQDKLDVAKMTIPVYD